MANGRRRPIAPVRKLAAAVLGTFATFVILFGAGMMSWAIVALGVALLVLAVSFLVVTAMRRGARAWVAGVAHVHSATEPPASSTYGRCEMQIVIDAPGVPPRSVKVRDPRVPVTKWPDPGATLPIMVAIDDPRHVRILWDDVLTHAEAAMSAEHLPPEFHDHEPLDDEILIEQDLPPWQRRDPDDDFGPMVEPLPVDLDDDLDRPRGEPVIIHHDQRPGGPIVLEGTLVDPSPAAPPLAKRAKPSPHRPRQRTVSPEHPDPAEHFAPEPEHSDLDDSEAARRSSGTPAPAGAAAAGGSATATATASGGTTVADPPTTARKPGPDAGAHDDLDIDLDPDPGLGARPPADPGPVSSGGIISGSGITVTVADLPRSVAFYRDMLGFNEIDGGDNNAVLASGNTRLVLWATPDVTPVNRRVTHLNLDVADVQAAYRQLRANGVRFTSEPRVVNRGARVEQWAAAFKDPDGHGIALTEWRDRTD
ncbi:VOC family protein [Polymorphospora lycopeni]|uniref:VOC family protein n=1 Tax=Polymorphospora lycopeni TaxID=3140240 RepID=A0ABV5CZN6_9ACTN